MTETIHIKEFCGIGEAKLDLAPINLFIGPQATGKSVAAKLIYFFRETVAQFPDLAVAQVEWDTLLEQASQRLVTYFGAAGIGSKEFALNYRKGKHSLHMFRAEGKAGKLRIEASPYYKELYTDLQKAVSGPTSSGEQSSESAGRLDLIQQTRTFMQHQVGAELGASAAYQQFFLPAARASLAILQTQLLGQINQRTDIDVWMPKFADLLTQTRGTLQNYGFYYGSQSKTKRSDALIAIRDNVREKVEEILKAKVEYVDGGERLLLHDNRAIPMQRASSGQQEALPLLLLLARFTMLHHVEGRSVFIEEPEAHLWPGAQKQIIYLLALMYRRRMDEMQLVLTTHSPYVLTIFNNLLEAGRKYAELNQAESTRQQTKISARRRKLNSIVSEDFALPDDSIAAWQFSGGKAKALHNNEYGVLGADLLDDVSDDLDATWDKLQNVSE